MFNSNDTIIIAISTALSAKKVLIMKIYIHTYKLNKIKLLFLKFDLGSLYLKWKGTSGTKKGTLDELFSLVNPRGAIIVTAEWENFDFYMCINCWKMHLHYYCKPF